MQTEESFGELPIGDLVGRFESDIRFGCHSTRAEASRSLAGQELQRRGETDRDRVVKALAARIEGMSASTRLDARVRDGLEMLHGWM